MESDHIEEFLPDGFLTSKGERCAHSAFRAGPGIHIAPRTGMQLPVGPGIQVQAAQVEPPPAYNRYELIGGPLADRGEKADWGLGIAGRWRC